MKPVLAWSVPAIVGIISWLTSWVLAFAFPANSYHPHAHDMQRICNRIFAFLSLIGPVTAIFAIKGVHKSSYTFPKRLAWYLLNVTWGIFTLFLSVQFWFWYAHKT